jgi:ABC-2 type transport system ATP-binding protein
MIRAVNLSKRFGETLAVDSLSFDIPRGQVVGFLGPNGAGKTTTMRLLTAFLTPDEGQAELMGQDVSRNLLSVRRRLGYLPENNPLYDDLEMTDALHFIARLRGIEDPSLRLFRVKAAMKTCGLRSQAGKKVGELSRGFRQRLGLAQTILHDPDVLILDEPTSSLDPNQVQEVRGLIRELKAAKTVLISTHILSEVTATCDRVIIINAGQIVADGSPDELSGELQNRNLLWVGLKGPQEKISQALGQVSGVLSVRLERMEGFNEEGFLLESESGVDLREPVFILASQNHWPIMGLRQERLSLEEVFRKLTQS